MLLSYILTCSKFGKIPLSGFGGDSATDRWTDGRTDGQARISPILVAAIKEMRQAVSSRWPLVH